MKAIQINSYGGAEVLEINENVPKPSTSKGQVLIEVHAASLNPVDWKIRAGYLKDYFPLKFPVTMGGDFSGVISEIGEEVFGYKVGDSVYGQASILGGGSGSFAQYAAASTTKISHKPNILSDEEAAAIPLAGVSAFQALEEHIKLKSGQKILIHGGAGGIGTFALQIAKSTGAYVATTVNAKDKEFVKSLGADPVIDYKSESFEKMLSDFDAVFDTVGGETLDKSFQVLKSGGIIVSMMGEPNEALAKKYGVIAIGQNTDGTTEKLNRLAKLVDEKKIKVEVDKVFSFSEAKEAFKELEQGHPRGKVVIKI